MEQRSALLVDGANMYAAAKAAGFNIDYKLLLQLLGRQFNIVRANYYTAVKDNPDNLDDPLIKHIDWLSFNGYKVITRMAMEYTNSKGEYVIKGNMDVRMTIDALCMSDRIDNFILGTGDGDFTDLVDTLHNKGLSVVAISTIQSKPPMIAGSLRRAVDQFIDLTEIREAIERKRSL